METDKNIVCRPTSWFKIRALGMGILFLGMGLYFFYDATEGYPAKNEIYFTHKAFEFAGQAVETVGSPAEWELKTSSATIDFQGYPVTKRTDPTSTPWPAELKNYPLMKKGWHDAWVAYTSRLELPLKPEDTPLDHGKIREQWIAGSISCLLFLACAFLYVRTSRRVMAIEGDTVKAAGRQFHVNDITKLDMRKWRNKGIAYAFLGDRRVRLDGFCYGGFSKEGKGTNAEEFMQALLSSYHGDIIDYE